MLLWTKIMRKTKALFPLCAYIPLILIICFSLISGCAKPPTEEMEHAAKAIAEAKQEEADLYVEDTFKKAEEALQRARDLIAEKEYEEAKTAALEATRLAKHSRSMVELKKEKMREETEQMLENVRVSIDEVKILLAKALKKKAPVNRDDVQAFIDMWESEIISLKDNLDAQVIRYRFDKLFVIQKQINHQKDNLTILLKQKET
jgi:F0F1-type ATP synthase membrane subunit b/b'